LGALVVASVFAQDDDCEIPNFQNFCSEVVSAAPNRTVDGVENYYLATVETELSYAWSEFTSALNGYADKYNFDVCDDCVTALKHTFCSALVPGCGFIQCIEDLSDEIEVCVGASENSSAVYPCATECALANIETAAGAAQCAFCEGNCISGYILTSCQQFMMSKDMCATLLSTCACDTNPNDIDIVCQFFSDEGYTIPYPTGLSCVGTKNWCASSNKRSITQQAGVMNVNQYVSLGVPQANGEKSVSSPLVSDDTEPPVSTSTASIISIAIASVSALIMLCF